MSLNEFLESASDAVHSALQPRVWELGTPMGWQQRDVSGTSPGSPFGGCSRLLAGMGTGEAGNTCSPPCCCSFGFYCWVGRSAVGTWGRTGSRSLFCTLAAQASVPPYSRSAPVGSPAKFLSCRASAAEIQRTPLRSATRAVPCRPAAPPAGCRRGRSAPPGPQRSPQPEPRGPAGPLERGRPRQRRPRLRAAQRRRGGGAAAGRAAGRGGPDPLLFPCRGRAPGGRAAGPERSEQRAGRCRARVGGGRHGCGRGRCWAVGRERSRAGVRLAADALVGSAGNVGGGRRWDAGEAARVGDAGMWPVCCRRRFLGTSRG